MLSVTPTAGCPSDVRIVPLMQPVAASATHGAVVAACAADGARSRTSDASRSTSSAPAPRRTVGERSRVASPRTWDLRPYVSGEQLSHESGVVAMTLV